MDGLLVGNCSQEELIGSWLRWVEETPVWRKAGGQAAGEVVINYLIETTFREKAVSAVKQNILEMQQYEEFGP